MVSNRVGRLVAATWWLFGFIIIASYTANLAAFLTVSRLDTPIESLDDLSKQYKVLYAPLNGSSAMTYFERMADIERRFYEIWKDMSLNDSLSPVERSKLAVGYFLDLTDEGCNGLFYALLRHGSIQFLTSTRKCGKQCGKRDYLTHWRRLSVVSGIII